MEPVTTTGTSATAAPAVVVMSIVRSQIMVAVREGCASAGQLHVLSYMIQCVDAMAEIIQMLAKPMRMEEQLYPSMEPVVSLLQYGSCPNADQRRTFCLLSTSKPPS